MNGINDDNENDYDDDNGDKGDNRKNIIKSYKKITMLLLSPSFMQQDALLSSLWRCMDSGRKAITGIGCLFTASQATF